MPVYAGIETLKEEGDWIQVGRTGRTEPLPQHARRPSDRYGSVPDRRPDDGLYIVTNRRGKQFNSMIFSDDDTPKAVSRDPTSS